MNGMKTTIERLQSLGLEWGYGDSRNPDEIKSSTPCMHTNSFVLWYKWKGMWRTYHRTDKMKFIEDFSCCETEEDIEEIIEFYRPFWED